MQVLEQIRNIFCVGRNYRAHAEELGNDVPTAPFLFAKPTHALVKADGQPIVLPGGQGEVHYEAELVFHLAKPYQEGMPLTEVIDQMALGIDFTLRDVQAELKKKGHPWLLAKGFPNSAVVTPFRPFTGLEEVYATDFRLLKNGVEVQRGNLRQTIFDLETIIRFAVKHFGLSAGDILFTGTPSGVGPVADGDRLELVWGEEVWGAFTAQLKAKA